MATKKQADEQDKLPPPPAPPEPADPTPAPDDVREDAAAVQRGEKDIEDVSDAVRAELAAPTEVRQGEAGIAGQPGPVPGVTVPVTEAHPETPRRIDEQSIAEFQQAHRQGKQG